MVILELLMSLLFSVTARQGLTCFTCIAEKKKRKEKVTIELCVASQTTLNYFLLIHKNGTMCQQKSLNIA